MRVHHIALRARDVDALVRFYVDLLGLSVVRDARPRSVWLGLGDARLMIESRDADEPDVPAGSLELVAFAATEDERRSLRAKLVAMDALEAETAHTLYFRDPEGRRVGVSSYPF